MTQIIFISGDSVFDNYGDLDIFIGRYGWECEKRRLAHYGIGEKSCGKFSEALPQSCHFALTLESKTAVMETVVFFNLMGQQQNSKP
jgi:hypothetical protein